MQRQVRITSQKGLRLKRNMTVYVTCIVRHPNTDYQTLYSLRSFMELTKEISADSLRQDSKFWDSFFPKLKNAYAPCPPDNT